MIRITFPLRRKQDLSFEEFQSYWLDQHGPLVASVAKQLNIVRYVQVHTITDPDEAQTEGQRGRMQKPYDGVAELWFESLETLKQDSGNGTGKEDVIAAGAALLEDERKFIDLAQSPGWVSYECPQINPTPENLVASPESNLIKLYYLLNHPQDQSFDDVQRYWRVQHGPLVRQYGPALQIQRYIQVHRLEDEFNAGFAKSRGCLVPPYFGHAELWYEQQTPGETSTKATQAPEAREGAQALYEDEARFIDFSRSALWFGKEHVIVDWH